MTEQRIVAPPTTAPKTSPLAGSQSAESSNQQAIDPQIINSKAIDPKAIEQSIERATVAKEHLTNFVYDAEDDVATALEAFSAEQLSRWSQPTLSGLDRTALAVEMFLAEGKVAEQSVIEVFLQESSELSTDIKQTAEQWGKSFQGLFTVNTVFDHENDGRAHYELTNWLTNKTYRVWPESSQQASVLGRATVGEIVLARLVPLQNDLWIFSGPLTLLGKLGKPKLAVAIGNFKKWFPKQLYGDAPELKEAAWESVADHYQEFVDFFGSAQITLSGYELNKKLQAYQEQMTEKQLSEAGLDSSKSLQEMAKEAGLSEEELAEAMSELGSESKVAEQLLKSQQSLKMVMPKITLPDDLRKAEAVTVFVHPRWGQAFLKDYEQLSTLLEGNELEGNEPEGTGLSAEETAQLDRLVQKYLSDEQVTTYVWKQLHDSYGKRLNPVLSRVLNQPDFNIDQDLDRAIAQHGKSLTPELPDTASVPIHLHNLFQEAMQLVSKGKGSKKKGTAKTSKKKKRAGFG